MNQLLVKLFSYAEDGTQRTLNIACQAYATQTTKSGLTYITVYSGLDKINGGDYILCSDATWDAYQTMEDVVIIKDYYQSCYVENSAGKTINKF